MSQFFVKAQLSERISETPQGFLLCRDVAIARTGTQEYLAREIGLDDVPANTVVVVNRDEAEVFSADTIASFEGATVTLGHPRDGQVTLGNRAAHDRGHVQNVRRGTGDESHLMFGDMLIKDADTIVRVKGGLREVSCGYDCHYVQDDAGTWNQTNIRGNHVAVVPRGRAGAECSIKDSIMSRIADKVRSIWARATDEAAALVADGEAAVAAATTGEDDGLGTPAVVPGVAVDAAGKVTIAADADMTAIVRDLMERLGYMENAKKETDAMVDGLRAAIEKLTKEDEPAAAAADAAPAVVIDADTIARAEILAPGLPAVTGIELAALTACYATDAGKQVINLLTGGKAPTADSVAHVFVPASEILKAQRSKALAVPLHQADSRVVRTADETIAMITAKSATLHPLY